MHSLSIDTQYGRLSRSEKRGRRPFNLIKPSISEAALLWTSGYLHMRLKTQESVIETVSVPAIIKSATNKIQTF